MKKRVLITGATGFVGRQILNHLVTQNVHLTLIVRDEKKLSLPESMSKQVVLVTSDLFSETAEWWTSVLQDIDTVIHVAWYAEPGLYLQSPKSLDCLQGALNMAKGAANAGVRRFVGVGTCFEYDLSYGVLSIETPIKPSTLYAAAKASVYMVLLQWFRICGIEFTWCRLFYLYGDGEDSRRLVPYLKGMMAAGKPAELTLGTQIRDYLEVSEAGRFIAETALGTAQGPVNVCSGIPVSVKQLAENIADEFGRRDLLVFGARVDDINDPPYVVGLKG